MDGLIDALQKKKRPKPYDDISELVSRDIDDNRPPAACNMLQEKQRKNCDIYRGSKKRENDTDSILANG